MVKGQKQIYFAVGQNYDQAINSPFYESFKGQDIPVLILTN
jgi:HSP90 family molecular chaperone